MSLYKQKPKQHLFSPPSSPPASQAPASHSVASSTTQRLLAYCFDSVCVLNVTNISKSSFTWVFSKHYNNDTMTLL